MTATRPARRRWMFLGAGFLFAHLPLVVYLAYAGFTTGALPPTGGLVALLAATVVATGLILWTIQRLFAQSERAAAEASARIQSLNRELEEQVRERTAELRAALAELEAFVSSVSHDLRAPIGAISSFAQLLQRNEAGRLTADGRELLAQVESNATRMSQLAEGLLEFSRLGRWTPVRRPVAMGELAGEALKELRAEQQAEIYQQPLPDCEGDRLLLKQVWTSLIGNALKYSRGREPARIEVGYEEASGAYFIRDNGVGFDMQYAGKLFGVFERLQSDARFEGMGISLAIAARIVERHGGRIWAEAAPGAGATFRFSLGDAKENRGQSQIS